MTVSDRLDGADSREKVLTCREVYEEGAALLSDLEDGRLDARLLLEHFCKIPAHRLLADPDLPVEAGQRRVFLEAARRRAAREPLAYVTGVQSFMGLDFAVSPDVLIPGQDTENLVEEALRVLEDGSRILDLCTGSGCILLSLLQYSNGCTGVGTDISAEALGIAARNADSLGLADRVEWLQGDLFSALEEGRIRTGIREPLPGQAEKDPAGNASARFDLIISNPPYIPSEVIGKLAPEVRCAEPRLALDGGEDGLDFYRRMIPEAAARLVIGGRLMLEIGYDQAEQVSELLREAGYYGIEILKDYGGKDRIATAVKSMAQQP